MMRVIANARIIPWTEWEVESNYEGSVDTSFNALRRKDSWSEGVFKMRPFIKIQFRRAIRKSDKKTEKHSDHSIPENSDLDEQVSAFVEKQPLRGCALGDANERTTPKAKIALANNRLEEFLVNERSHRIITSVGHW
jgi:hypothetical protein